MATTSAFNDPIDRIEWLQAETLSGNTYNPNYVMNPELKLLEHNILTLGWSQPLLVSREREIIDGYHRWRLAQDSKALKDKYGGLVPCVRLDVDRPTAMLLTVRMNRAKGVHAAFRMSALVRELVDEHGLERADLQRELGATADEIELLYQDLFIHRKLKDYKYSQAWMPAEKGQDDQG